MLKVFRRLEIYVVDTLDWTYHRKTLTEISPEMKKKEITSLIEKLIQSKDFVNLGVVIICLKKLSKKYKKGYHGATGQLMETAKKKLAMKN